ncbi:DNA/RNA polymerase [Dacryopinax primogenitus]|uniref:DNA polymerase epsilon catalytic subunit n=1 Tax=Dacryopinax primogenitus (strain DJM 731) TaxID=1858805 RepID=M5FVH2_DACPD|nr:DNA/RNA polymerase [Dacryopinax primogenitus]EJT99609.1 DNA/RNA polymerase [Dacryopinax primogenitus]
MVNMHPTLVKDDDYAGGKAGVDFYFLQDDGGMFKCTMLYEPYFYIGVKNGHETTVEEWLMKRYEGLISRISREKKEDLKMPNHLLGYRRLYLQLCFRNVSDLLTVRRDMLPLAQSNQSKASAIEAYAEVVGAADMGIEMEMTDGVAPEIRGGRKVEPEECIHDIREYDVPYYLRVGIDKDIRVGKWYTVTAASGEITLAEMPERVARAEPVVLAFDIETSKAPLKFPDQSLDQIMMISYMIDGQGFLITNREIVSEDIDDFEYTPKEGFEGPFTVYNEKDEEALIRRFFTHIQSAKPTVIATYNGDSFDFPFVQARAQHHGIDMLTEIGFAKDNEDEFKSRPCAHMDCFRWVKRDSYLPQGSQGLKAVTTAKLGYNPIELDPELMTPYAMEQPQVLAQYSVSDAVATYYLYMKYVHPFVFSLCNIIPLNPDEVLRKGTGTLCETLLMVQAYQSAVIMPNRHEEPFGNTHEGHLLSFETYVGGHVEALEAGVFRNDIPTHFKIVPAAAQQLIDDLDRALQFAIVTEFKTTLDDVTNYDIVKAQITALLEELRDNPMRQDKPLIYHLDVAAMYPNIMLSNRLQPDSVVDEAMCAVCDHNRPGKECDRRMTWAWRGEFFPAKRDEVNMIRFALNKEMFPPKFPGGSKRRYVDLSPSEQNALLHKRIGDYSRRVYKKTKDTEVVVKEAIICQRENPFYINTVRSFRDRRYEYKGLHKTWKKNLDKAKSAASMTQMDEANKMIVLYDSLQLAHKCILNSFYGYVMRKGARWHSMEMAGITCLTGANIIQMARQLVEQIGRPLELDTDGIWCMLPGTFPDNFFLETKGGKKLQLSYPCTMLNHLVHDRFTNHQYHDLVDPATGAYAVHSENSIFFELDGPYKAMILPSSKEEDKLLKKRYAVFNEDGSLAELKGFEVKRRGELQLIKIFQSEIFEKFLGGETLDQCYAEVAKVADSWLDVLYTKAEALTDQELVDLIGEYRSMSKTLAEYGAQKSTAISTAKRLAEFLGAQMVKDKGLACNFIISAKPQGAPVTERAVPVAIFSAEESIKRHYLRKWLKDNSLINFDMRSILDWDYYIERLGGVIQKLITIPAAFQKVSNPVPRVRHPDWLHRRVAAQEDKFQQHKITNFFQSGPKVVAASADIEDMAGSQGKVPRAKVAVVTKKVPSKKTKPLPDLKKNYPGWLKAMRRIWKVKREERLGGSTAMIVPAMFRGTQVREARSWDIFQIRPTDKPGRFIMWLHTDTEFMPIPLRVPRQFYVNYKEMPETGTFLPSYLAENLTRTLPHDQPCLNLFRITVPESLYLEEESHFTGLIANVNVDGVYEMQIPSDLRAVLKLGRSCSITREAGINLNRARSTGLDLHQLERPSNTMIKRAYLGGGKTLNCALLVHFTGDRRHVFALFRPDGTVGLHLVDPARERQPPQKLEEAYKAKLEFLRQRRPESIFETAVDYPEDLVVDPAVYHTSEDRALKAVLAALSKMPQHASLLLISSDKTLSYYEQGVPKISTFPVMMIPSRPGAHGMPVFSWQKIVVSHMMSRYVSMGSWLYQEIQRAAYHDVPVGNVPADRELFYADVDFSRRLMDQDILLWWSYTNRPDLGGREDDSNISADEVSNPEISAPGCFSNVAVALQLQQLAVDAVMQSALVNEMEGSVGGNAAIGAASHNLDEYTNGASDAAITLGDIVLPASTFAILKATVRSWHGDMVHGNMDAKTVLDHLWRWLCSTDARMFDPILQRFVHQLMKKTFLQLLAEFRRLGCSVISADFSQVILLTSKPPGTASAFLTYLLTAVENQELFRYVNLRIDRVYDFMLFMDRSNFGGFVHEDLAALDKPDGTAALMMCWNIQRFLPPTLQNDFAQIIRKFMTDLYEDKQKRGHSRTPLRVIQNLTQDQTAVATADKMQEVERVRNYVSNRLTRRLLAKVQQVVERYEKSTMSEAPEVEEDFEFPLLPGSYINFTSPPVEFVKFVCEVLRLHKDLSLEVGVLKRNLLDLVHVREFADEAQFKNPCESFKLPMVICTQCSSQRDMDFCRDEDLFPDPGSSNPKTWACADCGHPYDRAAIEVSLIDSVRRLVTAFQLQDMRCGKCKQIKSDNLSAFCACSGTYGLTLGKQETRRRLRTVVNVAAFHGLSLLRDYTEGVLMRW